MPASLETNSLAKESTLDVSTFVPITQFLTQTSIKNFFSMSAYRLFPLRGGSSLGDNPNSRLSSASAALGQEIELQPVTSSPPQADDNRVLRRLGKNPVLKVCVLRAIIKSP